MDPPVGQVFTIQSLLLIKIDAVHDEVYIYGKKWFLIQVTNDTFILLILSSSSHNRLVK